MSTSLTSFGSNPECKFFDGSFNNNRTNFGGKSIFGTGFGNGNGNDAINLHTHRPVQPASKLLDSWFNGNTTRVNVAPGSKQSVMRTADVRMMMPM